MFSQNEEFKFIVELEKKFPIIKKEFIEFYRKIDTFIDWEAKDIGRTGWDIIGLRFLQRNFPINQVCFPRTMKILDSIPNVTLAAFSRLSAKTDIIPHVGYKSNVLRAHLGIVVPDKCTLTVGGEERQLEEGKVIVFNDEILHSAKNDSDEERIVLLFDFVKPEHEFILPREEREINALVNLHKRTWVKMLFAKSKHYLDPVIKLCSKHFNKEINPNVSLIDYGADSLDIIEIGMALEDLLDMTFDNDGIYKMNQLTPKEICVWIWANQEQHV